MNAQRFRDSIWPQRDRLYRLALRLVGESTEAEDVVQETMIKLWEDRNRLAEVNNLDAWCTRLVRNLGIDRLRSKQRRRNQPLEAAPQVADRAPDPIKSLQAADLKSHIDRLMMKLPEQRRLVLHLREVEGLSYREIADQLGISLDQVRTDIHRARQFLRAALQPYHQHE